MIPILTQEVFNMHIRDYLGKSKKEVESLGKDNVVSVNNVNCTVEVKDICIEVVNTPCHAIFYFDLANNDVMTMALVKVEGLTILDKAKISLHKNFTCEGYIGSVTRTSNKDVLLTYIRENIYKAL